MAAEHARVLLETCLGIAFGFIIVDVISRSIMRAQGKEYHMGKSLQLLKKMKNKDCVTSIRMMQVNFPD